MILLHSPWLLHLLIFHLVIHPDGNIWIVDMVESARGREDAPAAPRHASLIVFVEVNRFRPGDVQGMQYALVPSAE
jgi:hypothetical protein